MSNPEKPKATQQDKPSAPEERDHRKEKHQDRTTPTIRHKHAVIHPAPSEVTHVDPGAIVF